MMLQRQTATTTTPAVARRRQRQAPLAPPTPTAKRPAAAVRASSATPSPRIIAVAVDQSRASRRAVSWAVEHVWREDSDSELRLFHVVPAVSSTSAFALGGLAAGVASAPLDSAASLDGGEGGAEFESAVDRAAAEAMAAAGFVSVATATAATTATPTTTTTGQQQPQQHHSTDEQRALARRAGRALSAALLPLAQRRGCSRATVAVIYGRPGFSVAEDLCRAAEASGAAMLVLASSRRPGGGVGGYDDGSSRNGGGGGAGGWLGEVLGSVLFKPPVSSEVARRCKVPTVLLGPE